MDSAISKDEKFLRLVQSTYGLDVRTECERIITDNPNISRLSIIGNAICTIRLRELTESAYLNALPLNSMELDVDLESELKPTIW